MKKSLILLLVIGLLTLGSCNQKPDVNKMLKNEETKNEIFNAIADNHDYMMGFMETMQNNEHAMQMMQNNKMMMGNMMKGSGMQMMMNDSTMMKNMLTHKEFMRQMMHQMITDTTQMNSMRQMMYQKGMMKAPK